MSVSPWDVVRRRKVDSFEFASPERLIVLFCSIVAMVDNVVAWKGRFRGFRTEVGNVGKRGGRWKKPG